MKNLEKLWREVLRFSVLHVPKARYTYEELEEMVEGIVGETAEAWLVRCWHEPNAPVNEDTLWEMEQEMKQVWGKSIPEELRQLLRLADGGRLFVLSLKDWQGIAPYARYHIFSTTELATINRNLLKDFRAMLGSDPDFRDFHVLNYVAFCDAHNGNYLAILLEGPERGKVFFLYKEYLFRPYSKLDADLYYTVAPSLEAWLELVVRTKGWDGFGEMMEYL